MKVLIADDDTVSSKILEKNIKGWNFEVITAANGEEAWRELKKDGLRLAILDWMMPGINGLELCRMIREEKKKSYTYIILLTSKDRQQDIIEGLQAGADDYMKKPVNLLELRARLQAGRRIIDLEDKLLESNRRLQDISSRDSLTSLWNRAHIIRFLEEELERSTRHNYPVSVIMIDIDSFKKVNDTCGHYSGDIVLIQVASRLRRQVRPYDKAGRYGGDEILIVLPNCNLNDAAKVADRLRLSISRRKIKTPADNLAVTVTLGCASSESMVSPDVDALIQASDNALYIGKNQGRNRVVLSSQKVSQGMTR